MHKYAFLISNKRAKEKKYIKVHGTYILYGNSKIGAVRKEQSLLFDLINKLIRIKSSRESDYFLQNDIFYLMRALHVLSYHLI